MYLVAGRGTFPSALLEREDLTLSMATGELDNSVRRIAETKSAKAPLDERTI
jgi:hypothetical protein